MRKAENTIASLMSKLKLGPSDITRDKPAAPHDRSDGTPSRGRGDPWNGDMYRGTTSPNAGPSPGLKNVVEPDDSKEYLGWLRPEAHLVPIKNYEVMN